MSTIIYNGQIISASQPCIKHNDRGLTLGHGLFETILIKKGKAPLLDYHWKRLQTSAPLIKINIPFSYKELNLMLLKLIKSNNLNNTIASARLMITQGEAERGILSSQKNCNFIIAIYEYTPTVNLNYSALVVNTRKNEHSLSCKVKSISYIDNIIAKQEAINLGFNEAILLNSVSNIADGAISNIFIVKKNQIYTPKLSDGALPGVIRSVLLNDFVDLFPINEKSIAISELFDADEIFITNALIGIQPIHCLNTRLLSEFPVANHLASALKERKNYI